MKKTLLFLMFGLLLSGCINDELDSCSADLRLLFTFSNSITRFDEHIRNDIRLDVYCEDIYHSSIIIPYNKISNGQEYRIKKNMTGNINFVAWSVPYDDDDTQRIPECSEGELVSEKSIYMKLNDDMSNQSLGGLYMGSNDYYEEDLTNESLCIIQLEDLICRVTVSITGFNEPSTIQANIPDIVEISGFRQGMTLLKKPDGDEGKVISELYHSTENNALRTGTLGLMPSGDDQFLEVAVFSEGKPLFKVLTEQRSIPGYRIDLIISNKFEVEMYVNGWRTKNAVIEWM